MHRTPAKVASEIIFENLTIHEKIVFIHLFMKVYGCGLKRRAHSAQMTDIEETNILTGGREHQLRRAIMHGFSFYSPSPTLQCQKQPLPLALLH